MEKILVAYGTKYGATAEIAERIGQVLREAGDGPGHIFNVGHGILPHTPVDNVRAVVDAVHEWQPSQS